MVIPDFILPNTSIEVVLKIFFLILNNANIQLIKTELNWSSYTTTEALLTTKRVKLIDKKEFAKTALDKEFKLFVIHIAGLEALLARMMIHFLQQASIAALKQNEALTKVSSKYLDYANIFSFDLTMELPENISINYHTIKLQKVKQPLYGLIYSLRPMKLKILKTYIKTYFKTGFFYPFKSPTGAPILFDKKLNGRLWLCINYWDFNDLTIKNRYPLILIGKPLDQLARAKQFTLLELTSNYHQIRIKKGDKWKIAVKARYGHFKYQVMFFKIFNASTSFHGYITKILVEKLDVFIIVYLDDIFIHTKNKV